MDEKEMREEFWTAYEEIDDLFQQAFGVAMDLKYSTDELFKYFVEHTNG